MNLDGSDSIPLWLLYENEIDAWRASQTPPVATWLTLQNFKAEKHRVVLLPDSAGGIAGAVGGLGRRNGALSLWHAAGFVERLPARRFHLAQQFAAEEATQLGLGFAYGAYRFDRYRPAKSDAASIEAPPNADLQFIALASEALRMARDWINTPAEDFGPAELAAAAQRLAERHRAVYQEWVGEGLLAANFPAIHAVGRASSRAPRLVELRWQPNGGSGDARAALPRVTLVGKGVCFDSGGLDLKPGSGMALMKKDMGGAAVALALAHMLMSIGIRAELRVLVPAVENSVSGNAYRPGDVLGTRKGLTVEVGNTDAEGRLVLCDALAYADAETPDLIMDFATLTGAARVALGPELPALFGNDDGMVRELARIAAAEHDPLWPMPLWAGYEDELASKIADLNNVASSSLAGSIFGALFLKRFVGESTPWLHLDLYAWNSKDRPGRSVGAEAQGVRAAYRYLVQRYGIAREYSE
ncbi:MAG TPA: leucyl aminopeptidase family protein [Steroidobacteraceae bacterium]|jgi:leucyl aminopeptidase|nr:leucyl aminopeptidase family protein [Steroidobacteraceae bacterium]